MFLPFNHPRRTVTVVIIRYITMASPKAQRKGSSKTYAFKSAVDRKERNSPLKAAKLPKKKYSKVLILPTVPLLAPKVLSKMLSRNL